MSWLLFAKTFAAVFIAELGDKTQLATMALVAGAGSRWTVFAGAASALVASTAIAVLLGEAVARSVPPTLVRRAAGVLFIAIGVAFLIGSGPSDEEDAGSAHASPPTTDTARAPRS